MLSIINDINRHFGWMQLEIGPLLNDPRGGTSIWNGYGCKAETSEPRGIRWERREKIWGHRVRVGQSDPKLSKFSKILWPFGENGSKFDEFEFFKFFWKFIMFLSKSERLFAKHFKLSEKRRAVGDSTHFWVRLWKIWGLWVRAMLKNGGLNSLTYASPPEWECPPGFYLTRQITDACELSYYDTQRSKTTKSKFQYLIYYSNLIFSYCDHRTLMHNQNGEIEPTKKSKCLF